MCDMTDAEIIKALECCEAQEGIKPNCEECPYFSLAEKPSTCYIMARKQALALINRQKAEIERLEKEQNTIAKRFYKEGIKEAKKKLPNITLSAISCRNWEAVVRRTDIDELFKKLAGDDNG